jgi:Mrp family chromosome partitioning ATPase
MAVAFEPWPGSAVRGSVATEVIAFHHPDHAVSKEYTALFDKMLQALAGGGPQTLMLCGSQPRVGATTALANLAVVAARLRRRVVVADMNFARPAIALRLGQTAATGLADVLNGRVAIEQALLPTAIASLHVLAGGAAKNKDARPTSLTAEAIGWLMARLRERFDVILLDGPSLAEPADLELLAAAADGIYLVLPQGEMDAATRTAAPMIARMGGRLRGMIHTHFDG